MSKTYYSKKDFEFLKFVKSKARHKKYVAILQNKNEGYLVRINFGDTRYQQYKDNTGLNLYSHLDHKDINRRRLYHLRHRKNVKTGYYSPSYFSNKYLW